MTINGSLRRSACASAGRPAVALLRAAQPRGGASPGDLLRRLDRADPGARSIREGIGYAAAVLRAAVNSLEDSFSAAFKSASSWSSSVFFSWMAVTMPG